MHQHKKYEWDQLFFKIYVPPTNITDVYELLFSHTKNKSKCSTTESGKGGTSKNKSKDRDNTDENVGMSYIQEDVVTGKDG